MLVAEQTAEGLHSKSVSPLSKSMSGFLVAQHVATDWELENIVVAATERRKGIGNLLLGALLASARETNSTAVFLEVRESNQAACRLYEGNGFQQTGRRKNYYPVPPEDAILYRLILG